MATKKSTRSPARALSAGQSGRLKLSVEDLHDRLLEQLNSLRCASHAIAVATHVSEAVAASDDFAAGEHLLHRTIDTLQGIVEDLDRLDCSLVDRAKLTAQLKSQGVLS